MDRLNNQTKSGGKLRKSRLDDFNDDLNMNLINNLNNFNQTNGSLPPPDLFNFSNLSSLNNLNGMNNFGNLNTLNCNLSNVNSKLNSSNLSNNLSNSFSNSINTNANQLDQNLMHHHHPNLANQFNKNAITSEFTSQSSAMLYPNLPFYQQQQSSKLTLSSNLDLTSNIVSPVTPPFGFHPYLTAALQNSILNQHFLQNTLLQQQQPIHPHQQLLLQNSLNNFHNLNGLNGLTNVNNNLPFKNFPPKPEFNHHLSQITENINLLNEKFLSNNSHLFYPNGPSDFILKPSITPSSYKTHKKQKLEPIIDELNKKEFESDIKKEIRDDFKDNFRELNVQTNSYLNQKLEEEFSPDSSTELVTVIRKSPNRLLNVNNNQSPIITSTKSSEHSISPDVPLHSSLNAIDQCLKLSNNDLDKSLTKEIDKKDQRKDDEQTNDSINNELSIDFRSEDEINNEEEEVEEVEEVEEEEEEEEKEEEEEEEEEEVEEEDLTNEYMSNSFNNDGVHFESSNCSTNCTNSLAIKENSKIETEDLYSLISKKSFQPTIIPNHKDVSLDRMSFDEEDEDNQSPIINFKNLIDNDLSSEIKDDEMMSNKSSCRKTRSAKKRNDNNNSANNPWCIRRSERIFLNECISTSSNQNMISLDKQNQNFKLTTKDLETNESQRVLIQVDDLLYAGSLAPRDHFTNKFCISLDDINCKKNNQILDLNRLLEEVIVEIKPKSIDQLYEGCRVCAYWTQKTKCLYPGRVVKLTSGSTSSLSSGLNGSKKHYVLVHFDDGDKNKMDLDEIRLLPKDFELKPFETDEENNDSSNSSNRSSNVNEDKKVEKLRIKISSDMMDKKQKKHHSKHHKHHHKSKKHQKHIESDSDDQSTDQEQEEWYSRIQKDQHDKLIAKRTSKSSSSKKSSSKIAPFLPERSLWQWHDEPIRKIPKIKPKKIYYNSIIRSNEIINVNDCAIFLSTGRPSLPYVGRIVLFWQNQNTGKMFVRVKWFYHPEETSKPNLKLLDNKGALFESSCHYDDNDVQTISHKCLVLPYKQYIAKKKEIKQSAHNETEDEEDIYYLSGIYDPNKFSIQFNKDVPMKS